MHLLRLTEPAKSLQALAGGPGTGYHFITVWVLHGHTVVGMVSLCCLGLGSWARASGHTDSWAV